MIRVCFLDSKHNVRDWEEEKENRQLCWQSDGLEDTHMFYRNVRTTLFLSQIIWKKKVCVQGWKSKKLQGYKAGKHIFCSYNPPISPLIIIVIYPV